MMRGKSCGTLTIHAGKSCSQSNYLISLRRLTHVLPSIRLAIAVLAARGLGKRLVKDFTLCRVQGQGSLNSAVHRLAIAALSVAGKARSSLYQSATAAEVPKINRIENELGFDRKRDLSGLLRVASRPPGPF